MTEFPVTRKEYEGLFNAITRLTDRIEALEKGPWAEVEFETPLEKAERALRRAEFLQRVHADSR